MKKRYSISKAIGRISYILMTLAALCASHGALAQENAEKSASDARAILNEMSATAKRYSTIAISFNATLESKRTNAKNTHKGTLKVKGEKYVLDINDIATYNNGTVVSVWQKKNNEVDLSDPDPEAEGDLSPKRLFNAYNEGYKLRLLDEKRVDGVLCNEIDLYPTSPSTIIRIRLSIDKKTKQIRKFWQQNKNGDMLTVTISKFQPNQPMADSEFTFDASKHPGIEVVDLR